MGCNKAQRQWFCLSMLPHCVPANVKKELDGKIVLALTKPLSLVSSMLFDPLLGRPSFPLRY